MCGFPLNCHLYSVVVKVNQAVQKRNPTIIRDLHGKLNVGVLSVEMFDFVFV